MRTGLKNKFFILFHILSLVLLLGLFSTSYATMSKADAFDFCKENSGYSTLFESPSNNESTNYISYANFLSYLENRTEQYYYVRLDNSLYTQKYFTIEFFDNVINVSDTGFTFVTNEEKTGTNKEFQTYWNWYYTRGNTTNKYTSGYTYSFPTTAVKMYMLYGNGEILAASFDVGPQTSFIPNYDHIVTVNSHNNVNAILRNYSIYQWKIGETENFSQLDAFMFLLNDLSLGYRVGNVTGYRELNQISGNGALYFQPPNLYVNSRYISYNHLYQLIVSKTYNNNETLEYYYFVFLPLNAVISNGQIISVGSGDYSVQDSTNAIIANQESGDNKIIGTLTDDSEIDSILDNEFTSNSGDIEVYAEKFGFTALDNPFTTFLLHILDSTFDALTEPNDVVLSADYKTLHFELNSGDFTTPASPLKDFIRNLLIFLYIYGNYRFFNHLIVLIQTAKIDKAIATLGTDEFYDSDIM